MTSMNVRGKKGGLADFRAEQSDKTETKAGLEGVKCHDVSKNRNRGN